MEAFDDATTCHWHMPALAVLLLLRTRTATAPAHVVSLVTVAPHGADWDSLCCAQVLVRALLAQTTTTDGHGQQEEDVTVEVRMRAHAEAARSALRLRVAVQLELTALESTHA